MSSQNGGNGFTFPVAMLLPPLAVVALRLFFRGPRPDVAIVALLAGFNVLANLNVWADASRERAIDVPGFGRLAYANGVPSAVGAIRAKVPGPETRFDDQDREWLDTDRALVEQVWRWPGPEGELPVTVLASRTRVLTTNSFQLAGIVEHHLVFPIAQLAAEPDDSVATYLDELALRPPARPRCWSR